MASEKDSVFWVYDVVEDQKVIYAAPLHNCKRYVEEQVREGYNASDYVILKEYLSCKSEPATVTFNKI